MRSMRQPPMRIHFNGEHRLSRNKRGKGETGGEEKRNRGKRKGIFEVKNLPEFCALSAGRRTPNRLFAYWLEESNTIALTFTFFPEKLPLFSPLVTPRKRNLKTVVGQPAFSFLSRYASFPLPRSMESLNCFARR